MSLQDAIMLMALDGDVPSTTGETSIVIVERVMQTLKSIFASNLLQEVTVELRTLSADELWEVCCGDADEITIEVTQLANDVLDAAFLAL